MYTITIHRTIAAAILLIITSFLLATPALAYDCTGLPAWNASTAYATAGTQVQHLNQAYRNNWWTQNQNPTTNSGAAGNGLPYAQSIVFH